MVIQLEAKYAGKYLIFSDQEKNIIQQFYKGTGKSIEQIKRQIFYELNIERTVGSIRKMAGKLGCTRLHHFRWTDKEVAQLTSLAGKFTATQISAKMNRSYHAVCAKASLLNIPLLAKFDWYSAQNVAQILGVWDKTVTKWIQSGYLKAERHDSENEKSLWHITAKDLKNFICKYPTELTGRNVDIVQLVEILTTKDD